MTNEEQLLWAERLFSISERAAADMLHALVPHTEDPDVHDNAVITSVLVMSIIEMVRIHADACLAAEGGDGLPRGERASLLASQIKDGIEFFINDIPLPSYTETMQ